MSTNKLLVEELHEKVERLRSTADDLIYKRTPVTERVDTVEIDTENGPVTVTVRGVSRGVFLNAQKLFGEDEAKKERYILSRCMVEPALAPEQVAEWQEISGPMEINKVQMKVNELSGIGKGADKSGVPVTGE